ncbi:MAG: replicative DNA helicase, partial [Anaerolineales bacterium]|nr:replicative DNA helicase [Anaerolineales bacterium]
DTSKYAKALWEVATWPLTIVDKATLTANDVLSDVQREQMQHGEVAAIFVDGLWLMTAADKHQNRVQEVGSISRDMKRVQRDLNLPIVMAHQLSRACELRSDKRPILSDLRETGDVEQDADVVLMMYREGYYDNTHPDANVVEVWIRKNRLHGPSGECVKLFWRAACMAFLPLAAPVKL